VNSPKARKLQDGGVEVIHAKTKNGRIDLFPCSLNSAAAKFSVFLLEAGPLLNGAALAAGIVHKTFSFLRADDCRRESRPLRARSRSSVFRRCATFARSSSAPISLWKPACTTFCVDLFSRHGHTFCQAYPVHFPVIGISAKRGSRMRRAAILFLAYLCSGSLALPAQEHHHELSTEEVGSVHFPISCSKGAELSFNRAVALLHSFQYEQARQAFSEISTQDPTCAIGTMGRCMSHYHGLWDNGDTLAGRLALRRPRNSPPLTLRRRLARIIYRSAG